MRCILVQVSMFCHGARIGFYQGDISLLMDDIKTLKPTFFPVVPRLLNRIYDKVCKLIYLFIYIYIQYIASLHLRDVFLCVFWKILGSVTSPLRRTLLHYAVRRKQAELSSGIVRRNSLWDKLVFNKIQVRNHTTSFHWYLCFLCALLKHVKPSSWNKKNHTNL